MGNRNLRNESILAALLESDGDLSSADTDSELEDHLSEDDVQSDIEEAFVDEERDQESIAGQCHVTMKPEMIMYYNQTKGGVDTRDQMCSLMSCSRKTNRWPMCLFYGMLNIAFVNAYIIYRHNVVTKGEKPLNRRKFMKHLSMALTSPYMAKRLEAPTLKRYLRDEIKNTLPKAAPGPTEDDTEEPNRKKRTYCAYCPSKIKRKASGCCKKCKKVICREHNIDMCLSCI